MEPRVAFATILAWPGDFSVRECVGGVAWMEVPGVDELGVELDGESVCLERLLLEALDVEERRRASEMR